MFNSPEGPSDPPRRPRATHLLAASEALGGHKPLFSPDGARILFVCTFRVSPTGSFNDYLCVIDADGADIVNITNAPATNEN